MTDSANKIERGQPLQHFGAVEPRLTDSDIGPARLPPETGDVFHLADRVLGIPLRFDIDGLHDVVLRRRVALVLVRQIRTADRGIVAVAERDQRTSLSQG